MVASFVKVSLLPKSDTNILSEIDEFVLDDIVEFHENIEVSYIFLWIFTYYQLLY